MKEPIDIFIAYAQADKALMERLRKQLSAAERIGLLDAWHDGEIEIGSDREEATSRAMENAEIILLLLSADFFASEYLYDKEMAQAMTLSETQQAKVIPVLLSPCTWQLTPLAKLQILPKNQVPITDEHWKHPDRAFKHVVDEIIVISNKIRANNGLPIQTYETAPKDPGITSEQSSPSEEQEDKPPLWKLALFAFLGLGAFAIASFFINKAFSNPAPKEPIGQETPVTPGKTDEHKKEKGQTSNATFQTIALNNLEWSAENINIESSLAWCADNTPANCEKYGRLYDFKTALSICPEGWRLPTRAEWLALSPEEVTQLKLKKGGFQLREASMQVGTVGFYLTSERAAGDEVWTVEYRGEEQALRKNGRYSFAGMSCRCVR